MGVTLIPDIHSLTKSCEQYSWGRDFVFFFYVEPACTHSQKVEEKPTEIPGCFTDHDLINELQP